MISEDTLYRVRKLECDLEDLKAPRPEEDEFIGDPPPYRP
jgi:hypothetical protein